MSIQDYFRRGQWMFGGIDTKDQFESYGTIIIDVFWLVFRDILNNYDNNKYYTPTADNIFERINELKSDSKMVIIMPSQKTRTYYHGLLEESYRYAYDYNLHVLRKHSKLMHEIYELCVQNYESENDVLLVKNNGIFAENEEVLSIMSGLIKNTTDDILIYTMSADFFIHSVFKNDQRVSFYDGNRVYNTRRVFDYLNQLFNLSSSSRKQSIIVLFTLFGNAGFPVHYECNIFLSTNYKFDFFLAVMQIASIKINEIGPLHTFDDNQGIVTFKSAEIYSILHDAIYAVDQTFYNAVYEFTNMNSPYYRHMLLHYKIANADNSLGYIDNNFSYPEGSVIEYFRPVLGYMLPSLFYYTILTYIAPHDKINAHMPNGPNLYYDSGMFSLYYIDGGNTKIIPINNDPSIYSDTSYILRTNSKQYINNYLSEDTLRNDQLKVMNDRCNITSGTGNPGFLEVTGFIDFVSLLSGNRDVRDVFTITNDTNRILYSIIVPYMPLVDKFIHRHR